MYPITAVTFITENTNSASPYPLTPKKLITTINTRNIVTHAALSVIF